jgi:hypothetical protein
LTADIQSTIGDQEIAHASVAVARTSRARLVYTEGELEAFLRGS